MEQVKVIDDNQDALLWRLRMINSAKKKIVLFTFKMRADHSGTDVLSALARAAERGVEEYILIDSVGSGANCSSSNAVRYLASFENVHFCVYNPVFFSNPLRLTFRLHDKILLIDDDVYMLGGRNTLDVSIGNYAKKYNIDRDVVVLHKTGEASVEQIIQYTRSMRKHKAIKELKTDISDVRKKATAEKLSERLRQLAQQYPFIEKDLYDIGQDGFFEAEEVRLIHGDPRYHFKGLEIWSQLVRLMKDGEDVLAQTPYIMCNGLMLQGIREVIKATRSFAIITNAPESGANILGCADYMNQRKKLNRNGIKIYECSAGQSLHTKSILIDDDISIVGSFNFDTRSAYMDTELMLLIRSKELNASLRQTAEKLIRKSRSLDKDGNEVYGEDYVPESLGLPLTAFYAVLRVMERPFRFLL